MAKLENFLPGRFAKIEELNNICLAENPEFENLTALKKKWVKNKFPKEADLDGIKIYETILDITPGENDSLEDRRFRVLSKLNEKLPYTWAQLNRMVAAVCGKDGFDLELKDFILMIYLAVDSSPKLYSIYELLLEVLPMNILIDIEQALEGVCGHKIRSYNIENTKVRIVPRQKLNAIFSGQFPAASGLQTYVRMKIYPR